MMVKKLYITCGILICCYFPLESFAFDMSNDDWRGPDKNKHFAVSFYTGAAATQFVRSVTDDPVQIVFWGTLGGQLPGLLHESMQGFEPKGFSYKDHAYNLAGALLGALLQNNGLSIATVNTDITGKGVVLAFHWRF